MKPQSLPLPHRTTGGPTAATSSSPIVLGIDPGGKTTGMVLRHGRAVLAALLVTNSDAPVLSDEYLAEVLGGARDLREQGWLAGLPLVAVEDVVHPNPHLGLANLDGLLQTAQVIGALRCAFSVVLVRPGGHGSAPLSTYPPELVGPHEPKGTGKLRHARSAWDVAGAARIGSLLSQP